MIDFNIESTCRICLEDSALYNIFSKGNSDDLHSKIASCINEQIENIEGYPCKICTKCKNIVHSLCEFKRKYQESCKILEMKLVKVKMETEIFTISDNELDYDECISQIVNKIPKLEEPDVKPPEALLGSLKEITIKRVNSNNLSQIIDGSKNVCKFKNNALPSKLKQNKVVKKPKSNRSTKLTKKQISSKKSDDSHREKIDEKSHQNIKIEELHDKKAETKKSPTPRLCDICGETFKKYIALLAHKKTHNKLERIFKCDKCSKEYHTKGSLNEHILRSHEKIRNATCDTCGMSFYQKKQLYSHIRIVHQNIKKIISRIYKCKFCDRSYHYKRGIVIHERSVHTGERPAVCKVCKAAFYDEVYLKEHMRLHTGDNPFKCPICWRGYAQRGNMKSHMRNHKISEIDPDVLSKLKPSYLKFLRP